MKLQKYGKTLSHIQQLEASCGKKGPSFNVLVQVLDPL